MSAPKSFSRLQITLHWIIAALVFYQIVLHESVEQAMHDKFRGLEVAPVNPHIVVGMAILALAILRLGLRLKRGVPAPSTTEPTVLVRLSKATQWTFYILLFQLPLSGIAMWFFDVGPAAIAHNIGRILMVVLILLHVAGAFTHLLWFKSDVFQRMIGRA